MSTVAQPRAVSLARNREYVGLVACQSLSQFGDQIARVAVAVLIFSRTHSAALTAATYATSLLPWVLVAPFLAGLGDRFPRRNVMAASDLYRGVVAAAIAIPHLQTPYVLGLVFLLTCGDPPFESARSALMPDVLGERYAQGQATGFAIARAAAFGGSAIGGLIVVAVGAGEALLTDAATFVLSAAVLRLLLTQRPVPPRDSPDAASGQRGLGLVARNPVARWCLLMGAVLAAFAAAAIALTVPWAVQMKHAAGLAGLMSGSVVLGTALGTFAFARATPAFRSRSLVPLAVASSLLLVPFAFVTSPVLAVVLLLLSGAAEVFQNIVNQMFVQSMPAAQRARAFGVAGIAFSLTQGVSILIAGLLADHALPSTIVGIFGAVGVAAALILVLVRPAAAVTPNG